MTRLAPRSAGAAAIAGRRGGKPTRFVRESISELRKVLWPSRNELVTYSIVVIVFVVIMVVDRGRPGHRLRQAGAAAVRLSPTRPS